jgi:hypothetical protein
MMVQGRYFPRFVAVKHRLLHVKGASFDTFLFVAHDQQVIVTTGPTAVGKTAVGLLLAQHIGGEVVSADSVQVYRGLDIGSDKVRL